MMILFSSVLWANAFPELTMNINQAKVETATELLLTIEVASEVSEVFTLGTPSAEGMTFVLEEKEESSRGDSSLFRYSVAASKGSYVIMPPSIYSNGVEYQGDDALYIDIGVNGPSSDLGPIAEPPKSLYQPWLLLAAGLIAAIGGFLWNRKRPAKIAPKARLLVQIQQVFSPEWSDYERAQEFSQSFRWYLQEKSFGRFTSLTPKESKEALFHQSLLSTVQKEWALSILEATDEIKYNGRTVEVRFWRELESTMNKFVSSVESE